MGKNHRRTKSVRKSKEEKVDLINNKKSPIVDQEIEEYLATKELDLTATLDKELDNDHVATQTAVNALVTGGATNIGDAIDFATNQFVANGNGQAVKAIVLLTDGIANRPDDVGDPEAYAIQKAEAAAAENIKIFLLCNNNLKFK